MSFKSSFTTPAVAAISFCLIGPTFPAVADILHVPGDFPTIQEAIDVAVDGDEVEVHPGTYFETIDFLGKAIIVRSSDGPGVTTIDGTGLNTSVVSIVNLEGADTVLQGFRITGGDAVEGGGMLIEFSNPCVLNCNFLSNVATRGGGMFIAAQFAGMFFAHNIRSFTCFMDRHRHDRLNRKVGHGDGTAIILGDFTNLPEVLLDRAGHPACVPDRIERC